LEKSKGGGEIGQQISSYKKRIKRKRTDPKRQGFRKKLPKKFQLTPILRSSKSGVSGPKGAFNYL
jgi:hypothetical protein